MVSSRRRRGTKPDREDRKNRPRWVPFALGMIVAAVVASSFEHGITLENGWIGRNLWDSWSNFGGHADTNTNTSNPVNGINNASVIVVCNLIPAHPSIAMINTTIASLYTHLHGLHPRAPLYIACDGLPLNSSAHDRLRYAEYIAALQSTYQSPHHHIVVANNSVGLSGNLKQAVDLVTTDFVYVIQHDLPFVRGVDHASLMTAMSRNTDKLRLVRFGLYPNVPRTRRELHDPLYRQTWGQQTYSGMTFTRTALWSDHNHLTRPSYYQELWPLFQTRGAFTVWRRPPERIMVMNLVPMDLPNCTKWCTHLYGPPYHPPTIRHLDGRQAYTSTTTNT